MLIMDNSCQSLVSNSFISHFIYAGVVGVIGADLINCG